MMMMKMSPHSFQIQKGAIFMYERERGMASICELELCFLMIGPKWVSLHALLFPFFSFKLAHFSINLINERCALFKHMKWFFLLPLFTVPVLLWLRFFRASISSYFFINFYYFDLALGQFWIGFLQEKIIFKKMWNITETVHCDWLP